MNRYTLTTLLLITMPVAIRGLAACGSDERADDPADASADVRTKKKDAAASDADISLAWDGDLPDVLLGPANDGAVITPAQGSACVPPCDPSEWCYVAFAGAGGFPMFPDAGPGDAAPGDAAADASRSAGCHALPSQCLPAGDCACIENAVAPFCVFPSLLSCARQDAGYATVACIYPSP